MIKHIEIIRVNKSPAKVKNGSKITFKELINCLEHNYYLNKFLPIKLSDW